MRSARTGAGNREAEGRTPQPDGATVAGQMAGPIRRRIRVWRRLRRSRLGSVGVTLTGLLALVAIFGPVLYPTSPMAMNSGMVLEPPSYRFPLGADQFGRDLLSRVLSGLRVSFGVGSAAVLLGTVVGVSTGLIAGYTGGWFEVVTQRLWDTLMAFPGALLGIVIAAILGPGIASVVLATGLVSVPFFSRVVRAQTLVEKSKEYTLAARCLGASSGRILRRHLLPNCLSPILVQASVSMSQAMLLEAALSFLGLGVQPPQPSLGTMLNESRDYLNQANWLAIFPGLTLVMLLMAINFLSDGVHEIFLSRRR